MITRQPARDLSARHATHRRSATTMPSPVLPNWRGTSPSGKLVESIEKSGRSGQPGSCLGCFTPDLAAMPTEPTRSTRTKRTATRAMASPLPHPEECNRLSPSVYQACLRLARRVIRRSVNLKLR